MRNTFIIHDDQLEKYMSAKKGEQVIRILTLVDASSEGAKLKQMCDAAVPENMLPLAGNSQGTKITFDITEISIFSGRPRLRGVVVKETPTAKPAPTASPKA
jgi:hypothetical protein